MVIFRAAQVILFSDDLPRAVAFYSRLGFTETFRVPTDGEPIHVDLVLNEYKIGIATAASAHEDHGLTPVAEGQRVAVVLWTETARHWPVYGSEEGTTPAMTVATILRTASGSGAGASRPAKSRCAVPISVSASVPVSASAVMRPRSRSASR